MDSGEVWLEWGNSSAKGIFGSHPGEPCAQSGATVKVRLSCSGPHPAQEPLHGWRSHSFSGPIFPLLTPAIMKHFLLIPNRHCPCCCSCLSLLIRSWGLHKICFGLVKEIPLGCLSDSGSGAALSVRALAGSPPLLHLPGEDQGPRLGPRTWVVDQVPHQCGEST